MGRYINSILAAALCGFACSPVYGYPTPVDFDGSILRWNIGPDDEPITYEIVATIEDDIEEYENSVEEAASIWNSVSSSYFRYQPTVAGQTAQVTINLERSIDGGAVSSGYAIFDKQEKRSPSHCTIYVLVENQLSNTSIAKTILHELGHCLGLGHSLIPEAIMSYELDKNSFQLDIDDEAALTRLYPADGSKPKLPPGCAVYNREFSPALLVLLLLFFPLFLPVKNALNGWRASGRSKASP